MVIGVLKINETEKVKNNPFYGDYEVKTSYERTIINEKCVGLVHPENGIRIVLKSDGVEVEFIIGRFCFTGEFENSCDDDTTFTGSFSYKGNVYEVEVDRIGQLVSFDEWFNKGSFEDCCEPDNHYTKRSEEIKCELLAM